MSERKPTAGMVIRLNNTSPESCFIRMEHEPYKFIYIERMDGDTIIYNSREGTENAIVLRDHEAALRFIAENNITGYKPIRVRDMYPTDESMN